MITRSGVLMFLKLFICCFLGVSLFGLFLAAFSAEQDDTSLLDLRRELQDEFDYDFAEAESELGASQAG